MKAEIWGQRRTYAIVVMVLGSAIACAVFPGAILVVWWLALVALGETARRLDAGDANPGRRLIVWSILWAAATMAIGAAEGNGDRGLLALLDDPLAVVLLTVAAAGGGFFLAAWRWPAAVALIWSLLTLGWEVWLVGAGGRAERLTHWEAVLPWKTTGLFRYERVHAGPSDVAALTLIGVAPLVAGAALGVGTGRICRRGNAGAARVAGALIGVALVAGLGAEGGGLADAWAIALAVSSVLAAVSINSWWSLLAVPFAAYLGELLRQAFNVQRDGMTAAWTAIDTDWLFGPVTFSGWVWLMVFVTGAVVVLPAAIGTAIGVRWRSSAAPIRQPA
jgi:hypothetical protein